MGKCHDNGDIKVTATDPCNPPPCGAPRRASVPARLKTSGADAQPTKNDPLAWFEHMIPNCLQYASDAKARGRHIVGIMCEYTPRELILAADAVPVCLCGGSAEMIRPAEEHLPANLCPLIKSTFGYHVQQANPFLEMADLVVAETTCDGKKKMYELMAESRTMHVLELPQKPDDADALAHWVTELRKLRARLEDLLHVTITDAKIRAAIRTMNRERRLRRQLAALMESEHPPLTGRQLLQLKSNISGIDADLTQYTRVLEMFGSKHAAWAVPANSPRAGPAARGGHSPPYPVRVLLTGVPVVHGAERVVELIETHGGLIVCMDNCTGLKPILEDVEETASDPIVALAEKYFRLPCSVMTKNNRRLGILRDLARQYRAQCVIDLIWQACLTYDVESYFVKKLAEDDLGLPYLRIETDYSPSDSARIALRVEALFETVQQRAGRQA
ncbi:MAG: 2-hydroxyacyl-CoA dehydratase family protein [Planctomycetes bacterium]|jgi:benzoyl-CoA reductase/2-hydroxyglutaryl-CoA dehydratase subunit BcrC/BadD/HgdB|nr:2-hydroxyacyl-CoA dehydratase family protein [Planctomycetota bacterium]